MGLWSEFALPVVSYDAYQGYALPVAFPSAGT